MMKNTLITFLVLLVHATSYAQENKVDTSEWSIDLDDVVVTAQYAPTDSRSSVHSIRGIKLEEIKQRGVTTLEQLLSQELSIRISQDNIFGSSLDLKGISGQDVQIMIDGIPLIGRLNGTVDLSQVNLHNIDRVEIVEGPLSVNYGTNALAGVINLITKKSQLYRYDTQVDFKQESIGRQNLNAAIGIRPMKKLLLRFQGGRNKVEGFNPSSLEEEIDRRTFQWNPKEQHFAGGSVRFDFANDQQLRYAINWFEENITNLGKVRRPQFKPYAFDDYYRTLRYDHSLHQEGSLGKNYYLKTTVGYNYFKRKKNTFNLDIEDNIQSEVENQQDTTIFKAVSFRPVIASKYQNGKLNFQFGLDIRYENGFSKKIKSPNPEDPYFSEIGDYAAFGSLQYNPLNDLLVQLGLRVANNTLFNAPLTPTINIKYSFSKKLTLRASYNKGFRSPVTKELFLFFVDANHSILGNSDLKPETSDNIQLAVDWKTNIKKHHFNISAAGFFNDIKQKIDLYEYEIVDGKLVPAVVIAGSNSTKYAYFNQSRHKTIGGNLRLSYTFGNLNINAGFSPIGRFNLLSESADNVSPFTFVFESNGQISYRFPKQELQLSLYIRHSDKLIKYFEEKDDSGNLLTGQSIQDGFTLSNFTISKSFWKKRIRLTGGVQNLFDVQNVSISNGSGGVHSDGGEESVGTGRNWFAGLAWNFGWN